MLPSSNFESFSFNVPREEYRLGMVLCHRTLNSSQSLSQTFSIFLRRCSEKLGFSLLLWPRQTWFTFNHFAYTTKLDDWIPPAMQRRIVGASIEARLARAGQGQILVFCFGAMLSLGVNDSPIPITTTIQFYTLIL